MTTTTTTTARRLVRVQWRQFWSHGTWTATHILDRASAERSYGNRSTLCGKHFYPDEADLGDATWGRMCRRCQKLAVGEDVA